MNNNYLNKNYHYINLKWEKISHNIAMHAKNIDSNSCKNVPSFYPIINDMQIVSAYNPDKEALLQASRINIRSEIAYVFGIGSGLIQEKLLKNKNLKKLYVIIMNYDVAAILFTCFDHRNWLSNYKAELLYVKDLKNLPLNYTFYPPCVKLSDSNGYEIRDLIEMQLDQSFNNKVISKKIKKSLKKNNYLKEMNNDKSLTELLKESSFDKAMVVGGGPSAINYLDFIRKNKKKYGIICVDRMFKTLVEKKIIPNFVVCSDPGKHTERFKNINIPIKSYPKLLYLPSTNFKMLKLWKGKKYYYYPNDEKNMKVYRKIFNQYPGEKLFLQGSTIHPCVDLAAKLKSNEILLFGADFCLINQQTHSSQKKNKEVISTSGYDKELLNGNGEVVKTKPSLVSFLRELEFYISKNNDVTFINSSKNGALIKGTKYL